MPKPKHHKFKDRLHHKIFMSIGIGLSVIAFWRGAWGLMDLYLFPNDPTLSFLSSFAVGIVILHSTHYIVQELM